MPTCPTPQPITVTLTIQCGDGEPEVQTFPADTVDIRRDDTRQIRPGDYLSEDKKTTVITVEQRTIRKA